MKPASRFREDYIRTVGPLHWRSPWERNKPWTIAAVSADGSRGSKTLACERETSQYTTTRFYRNNSVYSAFVNSMGKNSDRFVLFVRTLIPKNDRICLTTMTLLFQLIVVNLSFDICNRYSANVTHLVNLLRDNDWCRILAMIHKRGVLTFKNWNIQVFCLQPHLYSYPCCEGTVFAWTEKISVSIIIVTYN